MKKIFYLFILIIFTTNVKAKNIVYLDIQYIIDNSDIGKFYKLKIKDLQKENKEKLKSKEKIISNKEIEINNQKNILSKDEIEKKVQELNDLIKEYQKSRSELNKNIIENKKKFTAEILKLINPLLTSFVEKQGITLVVDKKNVLVGIKSLDITKDILKILNNETKKNKLLNEN